MGRRHRQREKLAAPVQEYRDDEQNVLRLRSALSVASRQAYAATTDGGLHAGDAWQRGMEFLFERLAVSWTLSGLEITGQRELLGRLRMASAAERQFVRLALREHVEANFPELQAP